MLFNGSYFRVRVGANPGWSGIHALASLAAGNLKPLLVVLLPQERLPPKILRLLEHQYPLAAEP